MKNFHKNPHSEGDEFTWKKKKKKKSVFSQNDLNLFPFAHRQSDTKEPITWSFFNLGVGHKILALSLTQKPYQMKCTFTWETF